MDKDEIIEIINTVLEMNEQADRSAALDNIRDGVNGLYAQNEELENAVKTSNESNELLKQRNAELYLRLDGKQPEEETANVKVESLDDVITEDIFE